MPAARERWGGSGSAACACTASKDDDRRSQCSGGCKFGANSVQNLGKGGTDGTTAAARSVVAGGPVRRLIRMGWGTTRVALALALATLGSDSPREPDHSCAGLTGPLEDDELLNPPAN